MGNFSISTPQYSSSNYTITKAAIVTDSIAQVPRDLANQFGIHVVPFSLTIEGKVYKDLDTLNLNNLYQRMRLEEDLRLTTSAPSIGEFYKVFTDCWENGADSIIYIGISSKLSHAYSSAEEAARMVHEDHRLWPIYLFDSHLATVAQGFLAIEAARLAQTGMEPQEIISRLTSERKHIGFAAGLETLKYLAKGGRIGKAAYMLGSAIRILPIVSINLMGEVIPVSRIKGYDNVVKEIIKYVKSKVDKYKYLTLAVMHADAHAQAESLRSMAVEKFHPNEIYLTDFTPTMVAHSGPGIIGLAYHWRS